MQFVHIGLFASKYLFKTWLLLSILVTGTHKCLPTCMCVALGRWMGGTSVGLYGSMDGWIDG